ncbi:hypothetical protein D5086_024686 [Populus alba]|uniref:Uncharacterized protein n=1 Tax=Populus alba TaxID=43335 RepID=A0ACC4B677_POPAL
MIMFCITAVTTLSGRLYYIDPVKLPTNINNAITGVALCGTLAGQLFFGWLGDKLGRKKVYGITLVTMVGCALLLAFPLDPQRRVWLVVSASSASGVVLALEETLSCDYV